MCHVYFDFLFWKDAVLSASVARAAAAAQAARAQVASGVSISSNFNTISIFHRKMLRCVQLISIVGSLEAGHAAAGGCAPHAIGGISDEDTSLRF